MERPQALTDNSSSTSTATGNLTSARQCYMTPDQHVQFYSNQEPSTTNQAATNQLITDYINQALEQPSYSGIASNNTPQPRTMNILKLKIIPPFNKDHFATKDIFETASNQCISAILRQFSPQLRTKLTPSKTFTMVGTRRLHTFQLVAPNDAFDVFTRLLSTGIEMLGRTVIPQSDSFQRFIPGIYPKHVLVRILQLPSICQDQELQDILDLPDSFQITSIRHDIDEIDGMHFCNGRVSAMTRVVSHEHEGMLRQWSIRNHENGTLTWNDIPIYAFIPALHQCTHCKEHRRPFHGHDVAWCRYARAEEQQRTLSTNCNQEVSVPPSNQATKLDDTTPTTAETNATNVNQDEASDSNQENTDNQADLNTDHEDDDDDDDSQSPWQTAPTHPRKIISATTSQSQSTNFNSTKTKADHNIVRLFTPKNLALQTPVKKKKKPPKWT